MVSVPITVKGADADMLPLTPGLVTTIEATLGPATRAAGTVAYSGEGPSKAVVTSAFPSNETCDPFTKLLPLTVRVNVAEPAAIETGEREVMAGPTTLNGSAAVLAPPGLMTFTSNWPVLVTRFAGTVVLRTLELVKEAFSTVPLNEICAPETKFAPKTVSPKVPVPTGLDGGRSE